MRADKEAAVKKVEELCKAAPIVGVVNLQNLPMAQLQRMRKKLSGKVNMMLAKKRLMKRALENLSKEREGIDSLVEKMRGIPALLTTEENPFALFSLIQKNKSKAAAKAGQIAPNDIEVKAGPTPFPPGPIISELGSFGLKTSVKDGKVEVLQDAIIAKEGDEITPELAGLLAKLGIEPMEIGLDLVCVFENGDIFGKDVLAIDEEEYKDNFTKAHQMAFNLAVEAGVFTKETTELLVQKAFKGAKAVAIEGGVVNDTTRDEILGKAEREARALKQELNIPDVIEEKPAEETSEPAQEAEKSQEEN